MARDLSPEDLNPWYFLGYAQLAHDDSAGYRQTCTDVLARFSATQDAACANAVAWLAALTPASWQAEAEKKELVRLAKLAEDGSPRNPSILDTLGAVLYRAGQFSEAEQCLAKVVAEKGDEVWASTCFFLAMTCQQLGRQDEAKRWLDTAIARSEKETDWQQQVINRVLRQEAEALLPPPAPPAPAPAAKPPPPLPDQEQPPPK
jgi:predicted Zn-dependent protease